MLSALIRNGAVSASFTPNLAAMSPNDRMTRVLSGSHRIWS